MTNSEVASTAAVSQAESLLGETLRTGRLRYVFQPIWNLRSGVLIGFDALPRFRGGTSPLAVWSAAGASGLRVPLERIAARQAALQAQRLPGLLFVGLHRCCTESPGALQAAAAATLDRGPACPERLVFDLGADDIEDLEQAGPHAARLRLLGGGLCLNAGDGRQSPHGFAVLGPKLHFLKLDAAAAVPPVGCEAGSRQRWVAWARSHGLTLVATRVDDRAAQAGLLDAGFTAVQGAAFGQPAPAPRWTPQRLSEVAPSLAPGRRRRRPKGGAAPARGSAGRPEPQITHARAPDRAPAAADLPPAVRAPSAVRVPSVEEVAARWRPLAREDSWVSAVRDLQRHLERLARADRYALWACLPPHGHWQRVSTWIHDLRVPTCLPPDTEPMATVRSSLQPVLHPPAPASAAYRRILDEVDIRQARLMPLTVPGPAGRGQHFVGILALGWSRPTQATGTEPRELMSVAAYLLAQRIQATFIETALEWVAAQPAPATSDEWVPLLEALAERFGGDHWLLFAVDAAPGQPAAWHVIAESGLFPGTAAAWSAFVRRCGDSLGTAPGLRTAAQGRIAFLHDLHGYTDANPALHGWHARLRQQGLRSLMTLPLGPGGDGRIGVLVVSWRHRQGWQQIDATVRPWEALRRLLAGWWREMTTARNLLHDPLTGLFNRRGVARAWSESASSAGTLGIIDCDGFHQVNNLWGHLGGDDVLRSLGRILEDEAGRVGGWCGRWGGDEFVARLPEGIAWGGFGRRVQKRLAELGHERGWPQPVTISGGAARFRAPAPPMETVLELADGSLLRTKAAGGGRFRSHRRILA